MLSREKRKKIEKSRGFLQQHSQKEHDLSSLKGKRFEETRDLVADCQLDATQIQSDM